MFNITFEYPYVLLLVFVFLFCSYYCKAKIPTLLMPHLEIYKKSAKKSNFLLQSIKSILVISTILALASPVKIKDSQIIKNDGINIVLDLDASGSMKYKDLDEDKNRFDVLKEIVGDFIEKRVNDNIALVVFGEQVLMASPLSFDKEAQKEISSYLEVEMAGSKTAMLDSLASSINILKDKANKSNIIILLSDGEDNSSNIPLSVILRLLKKYNIKVYTIGIGRANAQTLDEIAKQSKGKYFTAFSKDDLKNIYKIINTLEKSEIEQNKIIFKEFLFFYPLFLAIISLIIYIYLKNKE